MSQNPDANSNQNDKSDNEPGAPEVQSENKQTEGKSKESAGEMPEPANASPPPAPVAKTVLDLDALRKVAEKLKAGHDERLKEKIASRPQAKQKESIDSYRNAAPCGLRSPQNFKEGDRIGFCEGCKQQVYDFNKMEVPEAKLLVLQREGKNDPVLYKRQDGRFMSSDCPVGKKLRLQRSIILIASALVSLLGLLALSSALKSGQALQTPGKNLSSASDNIKRTDPSQLPLSQAGGKIISELKSDTKESAQLYRSQNPIDPESLPMGKNFKHNGVKWQPGAADTQATDPATLPMGGNVQGKSFKPEDSGS